MIISKNLFPKLKISIAGDQIEQDNKETSRELAEFQSNDLILIMEQKPVYKGSPI